MHRSRGGAPAERVGRAGAADAHRDVERAAPAPSSTTRRAAWPRPRRSRSTTAARPRSRSATARATSTASTCRTARSLPGWGSGTGSAVGSGQGCLSNPVRAGRPTHGRQRGRGPGEPARSTRPRRSTATATCTSAPGTPPRRSTAATTPTRRTGPRPWNQVVTNPPTDTAPDGGVQASLPIADGGSLVEGGSLGQMTYALNAANGAPATGWPQFSADSVFSTAAAGDLYGTGSDDFVVGGASSQGFAFGTHYANGGHVRIYNDHGGLVCSANTTEEVDSSPAVGPILPGGRLRDRHGHRQLLPGRQRREHGQGLRHQVQPGVERHARRLDGRQPRAGRRPGQRPARRGRGHRTGATSGSVWALNAATGAVIWQTNVPGAVFGSVTTADLDGQRRPGRHRADRPRPLHPRRPDRARWSPTSTTVGPAASAGGPTASRTPRSSRPTPTERSASPWPGTSRSIRRQLRAGHRAALRGDGLQRRPTPTTPAAGRSSTTTRR